MPVITRVNNLSMHRLNKVYLSILLLTLFTFGVSWADDFPSWLSGKPDLNIAEERSALYDWVLNQADEQTNGLASQDALAKKRLVNLSNKLADYSNKTVQKEFSAHIKYLIIGVEQPMHFKFVITNEKLHKLLQK